MLFPYKHPVRSLKYLRRWKFKSESSTVRPPEIRGGKREKIDLHCSSQEEEEAETGCSWGRGTPSPTLARHYGYPFEPMRLGLDENYHNYENKGN